MERDRAGQAEEREIKTQERHRIEQENRMERRYKCTQYAIREPEGKSKAGSALSAQGGAKPRPPPSSGKLKIRGRQCIFAPHNCPFLQRVRDSCRCPSLFYRVTTGQGWARCVAPPGQGLYPKGRATGAQSARK